jgi:DNA-binding PucR family transcriptional regulator
VSGPPPAWTSGAFPVCSPACEQLIARTARRVEARVDEIAAGLVERVRVAIAALDGDDDLSEEILAAAKGSATLLTAMAGTWADPRVVPPPHEALEWSRSLVRRGIPIDVLLRVYRNGQSGYHGVWHQELVASGAEPDLVYEALNACSAFFFTWVEAICQPLVNAYQEEQERRLAGTQAVRSQAVEEILAGLAVDVRAASACLDYELERTHLAFLAWSDDPALSVGPDALEDVAFGVARVLADSSERPLVLPGPSGTMMAWAAGGLVTPDRLASLRAMMQGSVGRVAIGASASGVPGFRKSHDQARRARRVARLLRRRARVTPYQDVVIADLLTRDVGAAREVARVTLGPLAGNDDASRRLLATLRVFFEEAQSYARTARRLGLHQNTVSYRVRRAIELTGEPGPESATLQAALTLAPLLEGYRDDDGPGLS